MSLSIPKILWMRSKVAFSQSNSRQSAFVEEDVDTTLRRLGSCFWIADLHRLIRMIPHL
jgi:hypothetical protein